MLRGLSTRSKVRLGLVGVGLIGCFGYALLHGKPPGTLDEDALAALRDGGPGAEIEREQARRERLVHEEEARAAERRRHRYAPLLGRHAEPGPAFDGLRWQDNALTSAPDAIARALAALQPLSIDVTVVPTRDGLTVSGAGVTRDDVIAAWGSPDLGTDTWISPAAHWCASIDDKGMTWRKCQPLDGLARDPASGLFAFEPISLLGARAADLTAALGAVHVADQQLLTGELEGLAATCPSPTIVVAHIDRDQIAIDVRVMLHVDGVADVARTIDTTDRGGRKIEVRAHPESETVEVIITPTAAPR
jgi:hypothetical protein